MKTGSNAEVVKSAEAILDIVEVKGRGEDLEVIEIDCDVPEQDLPEVLDWPDIDAKRLFGIGHQAGERFATQRDADTPHSC